MLDFYVWNEFYKEQKPYNINHTDTKRGRRFRLDCQLAPTSWKHYSFHKITGVAWIHLAAFFD